MGGFAYNSFKCRWVKEVKGKSIDELDPAEKQQLEESFMSEAFPGAQDRPDRLVSAMLAGNPDSAVAADIIAGDILEEVDCE